MLTLQTRTLVRLRQAQQGCAHGAPRAMRRAGRIAGRAMVYGVAPSVATDTLMSHKYLDTMTVVHECANSAVAAAAATCMHDLVLIFKIMKL